jgi:chaperonin cofactor prefoldin
MRMPRASNSGKRHQGASNHRDTRHENGLVGPGKRVIKQKSQSQLDGGSKPAADNASVPPVPLVPATANGSPAHSDDMAPEHKATELLRRASLGSHSESSSSSTDSLPAPAAHSIPEDAHRRIDVNDAKNTNVHRDPGPLDFVVTVLRSCPLQDTIAILIILMQASPAVLTGIYMLFTCLTFVPPVTTSSGLSVAEIFDGSQGTPSLTTLICMDVMMLLIWLFLWAPMQQFILNLAQVVISLTLGGGGSSRQRTTSNIALCVALVGFSHWTQDWKWGGLSRLTAMFGSNRFLSEDAERGVRAFDKKGPYGWVRSVLAIHILTQGLVRCIREWYLRRERRDLQSQGSLDPESGKSLSFPAEGCSDVALMAADSDIHLQTSTSHLSSKKRRRQSAQVRIRQPLWAALASTKIVMIKEYELQHATNESAGSNATDIHNLGNAPFSTQPEQIWICYVGCDEVCFNTSHFPDVGEKELPQEGTTPGIDVSKPFYVRVNNAIWQPTRIIPIENPEENYQGTRWTGDIYGLTPLSNYECEFVSTRTGEVIFSTSVRTLPAKSKDPEVAPKAASNPRSHARHDSPATTLRASIVAAEVKLAEEKARLKAVRKDNNRKLNAARKEIERLSTAVQSAGGDDEKLRQKIAQNRIQEKRAEESIRELETQLKELETVPEDLLKEQRATHGAWTSEKAKFDQARADFKNFKASIDKQIKSLEEENASLRAKRNKIAARIAKVDDEHARITDANARGLNEVERRRQERAELQAELARAEHTIVDRIQTLQATNAAKQAQIHDMAAQLQTYLASFHDDMPAQPNHFAPSGPWGAPAAPFATQAVWPPVSMPAQVTPAQVTPLLAPSQLSAFSTPLQATMSTPPPHRTRGRSSSMLSDVTGFTQSTDEDEHDGGSMNHASTVIGRPNHQRGGKIGGANGNGPATLRSPPGFHFKKGSASGPGSSGSASGSGSGRSSVRSGSGSGASLGAAASPV